MQPSKCNHLLPEILKILYRAEQRGKCTMARKFEVTEQCSQHWREKRELTLKEAVTSKLFISKTSQ
jgi:hypothetical protein